MSEINAIATNNYILQAPPPTATMFTTELEYDGDKISGYAGSAFKAGTDLEFGYTDADTISSINNSAITDVSLNNIVQTNSGAWGGSALPVSAGEGVKIDYTNGMLVFKQDRTQLYSGNSQITGFTASEPLTNFERVEFVVSPDPSLEGPSIITYPMIESNTARINLGWVGNFNGWKNISWNYLFNTNDNIVFTAVSGSFFGINGNGTTGTGTWNNGALYLFEVNGINRKA